MGDVFRLIFYFHRVFSLFRLSCSSTFNSADPIPYSFLTYLYQVIGKVILCVPHVALFHDIVF